MSIELQWQAPETAANTPAALPPDLANEQLPADIFGKFSELLTIGDIIGMQKLAAQLQHSQCCPALAQSLKKSADAFDMTALQNLLRDLA